MNTMKVLADEYQGKVRFGYVNVIKHEHLKETFEIFAVPQNFYCVPENGKVLCHEMQAMSLGYMPVRKFIEGEYKTDPTKLYQTFDLPTEIGQLGLYWKYFIKDFTKNQYNTWLNQA
jgi:hypothetical protein